MPLGRKTTRKVRAVEVSFGGSKELRCAEMDDSSEVPAGWSFLTNEAQRAGSGGPTIINFQTSLSYTENT